MTPTLYVVRHGHTDDNANTGPTNDEYIRGHRDVPLNDDGIAAASDIAKSLAKHSVQHIWSSDMARASDTASAIAGTTGAPVTTTKKLRDWHMGIHEGELVKKVLPRLLDHCLHCTSTPVEGGEAFQTYVDRLLPFMRTVLSTLEKDQSTAAVVTHGRNTRLIKGWVEKGTDGTAYKDEYLKRKDPPVQPGEVMVLQHTGGQWRVKA